MIRSLLSVTLFATSCVACFHGRTTGYVPPLNAIPHEGVVYRFGWVAAAVRDSVAKEWSTEIGQDERGYCVTRWTQWARIRGGLNIDGKLMQAVVDSSYMVLAVEEVKNTPRSPTGISLWPCGRRPIMHVHPPQSCYQDGPCQAGGVYAFQCMPSSQDLDILNRSGAPFSVILCGPEQWVFYYPHHRQAFKTTSKQAGG